MQTPRPYGCWRPVRMLVRLTQQIDWLTNEFSKRTPRDLPRARWSSDSCQEILHSATASTVYLLGSRANQASERP
jgi:hypothetical protein